MKTILLLISLFNSMTIVSAQEPISSSVEMYVKARLAEVAAIPEDRKKELLKLSRYITSCRSSGKLVRLLFVCTHNSRRSHLAQLWAKIGAVHFRLDGVESFSGGTETTAMNPRTVAALERAGLTIASEDKDSSNPKYSVGFGKTTSPQICFSKTLAEPPNPTKEFAAIMTCSSADASCPNVKGCEFRLALPYEDPKGSDDTPEEAATYDAKCKEMARDMVFVMSRVSERP